MIARRAGPGAVQVLQTCPLIFLFFPSPWGHSFSVYCGSLIFVYFSPATNTEGERDNMLPPGLGKPPPLLPTPPGPPQTQSAAGAGGSMSDHQPTTSGALLPSPGVTYKTI